MMFTNKKFKELFRAEALMPLLIVVPGVIASYYWTSSDGYWMERLHEEYERAMNLCKIFYKCSIGYGIGLSAVLAIVGLSAFVIMLVRLFGAKKERYNVARPLVIFLWSGLCILETLFLMILVIAFTYGQGI